MSCKGICHRYKAKCRWNQPRYANGQKRCNTCEIFLEWNDFWCPCCGKQLRGKPKNGEHKRKFLAQEIKIKEIPKT